MPIGAEKGLHSQPFSAILALVSRILSPHPLDAPSDGRMRVQDGETCLLIRPVCRGVCAGILYHHGYRSRQHGGQDDERPPHQG